MRKNIQRVIAAFIAGKAASGDSKRTCWTNGTEVYSYALRIAWRLPSGAVHVIDPEGETRTTTSQIRAINQVLAEYTCTRHEDCHDNAELGRACGAATQETFANHVRGL